MMALPISMMALKRPPSPQPQPVPEPQLPTWAHGGGLGGGKFRPCSPSDRAAGGKSEVLKQAKTQNALAQRPGTQAPRTRPPTTAEPWVKIRRGWPSNRTVDPPPPPLCSCLFWSAPSDCTSPPGQVQGMAWIGSHRSKQGLCQSRKSGWVVAQTLPIPSNVANYLGSKGVGYNVPIWHSPLARNAGLVHGSVPPFHASRSPALSARVAPPSNSVLPPLPM
jgi:hypothetical protein